MVRSALLFCAAMLTAACFACAQAPSAPPLEPLAASSAVGARPAGLAAEGRFEVRGQPVRIESHGRGSAP